jgi:hypothetical protein
LGVGLESGGVSEPDLVHDSRPEAFDETVGVGYQPADGGHVICVTQVNDHALLSPVDWMEVRRVAALEGTGTASRVAARGLELDHPGAQVAKDHGCERASQVAGEVEHDKALEW